MHVLDKETLREQLATAKNRIKQLEFDEASQIKSEIQCMKSCLSQGWDLQMYIESQEHLSQILDTRSK